MLVISEARHQIVIDARVCQLIHGQDLLAGKADAVKNIIVFKKSSKIRE
jgi:hypothetical protein